MPSLLVYAVVIVCSGIAYGASDTDVRQLAREKERAPQDRHLTEPEKKLVIEKYDNAIRLAGDVTRFRALRAAQQRQKAALERETRALRDDLLRPAVYQALRESRNENSEAVDDALDRALSERNARIRILADLSRRTSDLSKRQNEIGKRRTELGIASEATDDELPSVRVASGPEPVQAACRTEMQWRKTAINAEIEALNAEKETLLTLRAMIPLQRDAAKLHLEAADRAVENLKERSRAARARDAARELSRVRTIAEEAAMVSPALKPAASDVLTLSDRMWGPSGAIATKQDLLDVTARMKLQLERVKETAASIKTRYESAPRFAPVREWLHVVPSDLPNIADIRRVRRRTLTREAVLRRYIVSVEEQWRTEPALEAQIDHVREVARAGGGDAVEDVEVRTRELLQLRRNLAEDLVRTNQELETRTSEFSTTSADLLHEIGALNAFASERVLWSRSTADFPSPKDAGLALLWFLWNPDWKGVLSSVASSTRALVLGLLGGVALAIIWRRRRKPTGEAPPTLLETCFVAAALPGVLVWIGILVGSPEGPALGRALQAGCTAVACALFPMLFLSCATVHTGIAERYFGWPTEIRTAVRRELSWLLFALPVSCFFVAAVAEVGSLFSDPPELQAAHNSLGRYAFFSAMFCLLVAGRRLLKPDGAIAREMSAASGNRILVRVLVHRGTLLVLIVGLISMAAVGFFTTALVLARNLFWTACLTAAVAIAASAMVRWREDRKRRLLANAGRVSARTVENAAQVRQLTRFTLLVVWAIVALGIWSNVFPALARLEQVQLVPSATMARAQPQVPSAGAASRVLPGPQTQPPATSANVVRSPDSKPLTLLDVLEAVLAIAVTILLVKNVPGAASLVVLDRLRLDAGASYAAVAVTRYVVMIVGLAVASRLLGIRWSQVQWLAAALTFGIGFGLQEIFANFASGLILLFDRSIRVGDAVSVGELSGRVSRIQMRATTVTLWDRSEMIVPNKEFITTKLINWTLSLPETRVDVKVGVAYGSDLDLVRRVLNEIAAANPNVLQTPRPEVLLTGFADSSVTFELRAYCLYEFGRMVLLDELHTAVYREFDKHGISIAFPQLDVHLQTAAMNAQAGTTT